MQTSLNKEQFFYAGFYSRLAAFITDSILVAIVLLIVKVPIWLIKISAGDLFLFKPFLFKFTMVDVLYYLLTLAYFVLMTYYSGATVGKHLLKLKVVSSEGQKLTFMSVLIRESVGKYLSAFVVYIGYIMAAFDGRKQGLHDKIADTCVVYKHGLVKQPVQPMQPAPPVQPTAPVQPMQPAQPIQPMPPVQPTAPVQPMQPAQPMQPTQPAPKVVYVAQPMQNGRFSRSVAPDQDRRES